MNTPEGEQARATLGIDGTAGDAQDIRHPFVPAPDTEACLACGLSKSYRKHETTIRTGAAAELIHDALDAADEGFHDRDTGEIDMTSTQLAAALLAAGWTPPADRSMT